jgi:ribosomal protein L16 Arg81 hydroxylase
MHAVAYREASAPDSLEDLLDPLSITEFFQNFWNRQFRHQEGAPERFERLFSWSRLNEVLEQHRLRPPRLRLYKKGQPVDAREYMFMEGEPRLVSGLLTRQLSAGATLILDEAEEFDPALRNLTVALERLFRARVNVNLYAGWRTDNGFRLHWDPQDTLILQVAGRKRWEVHAPTRQYPVRNDIESAPEPEGAPVWDAILEPGGLLYMPRGWWHVACPLNEPCLHLTITINMPKGIDLLEWIVDQLKTSVAVRMDLPYLASIEEQARYLDALRKQFLNAWSPGAMAQFLAFRDSKVMPRPVFQLPLTATEEGLPVHGHTQLRLTLSRPLDLPAVGDTGGPISFFALGRRWECDAALAPALKLLNCGQSYSLGELSNMVEPSSRDALAALCRQFVTEGMLVAEGAG